MDDNSSARSNLSTFYSCLIFGLLFLTWIIFSGLLDPFHMTLGLISCGFVAWISGDLLFENRSTNLINRLAQAFRFIGYICWLLYQIVIANLHLLKLAFVGPKALQPQIVRYESELESDFEKFLLANSITLTPGTVTIKIMDDIFYIHAISDVAAKGLDGEMEKRIAKIFKPCCAAGGGNSKS